MPNMNKEKAGSDLNSSNYCFYSPRPSWLGTIFDSLMALYDK